MRPGLAGRTPSHFRSSGLAKESSTKLFSPSHLNHSNGHGSKSHTPSEHPNPHLNGLKWVVHLLQNGIPKRFDPRPNRSQPPTFQFEAELGERAAVQMAHRAFERETFSARPRASRRRQQRRPPAATAAGSPLPRPRQNRGERRCFPASRKGIFHDLPMLASKLRGEPVIFLCLLVIVFGEAFSIIFLTLACQSRGTLCNHIVELTLFNQLPEWKGQNK